MIKQIISLKDSEEESFEEICFNNRITKICFPLKFNILYFSPSKWFKMEMVIISNQQQHVHEKPGFSFYFYGTLINKGETIYISSKKKESSSPPIKCFEILKYISPRYFQWNLLNLKESKNNNNFLKPIIIESNKVYDIEDNHKGLQIQIT